MGELNGRRAWKKARTRAEIRGVAQRLFAERGFDAVTIADIAAAADVAVQTVFNHFATKEDLFFDDRTPWVTGPADAVRRRSPGEPPLAALRRYLIGLVGSLAAAHHTAERRSFISTIEASPALRVREMELVHESERRLAEALAEAWSAGEPSGAPTPGDRGTAAALTAAAWLSVCRVLLVSQRPVLGDSTGAARAAATIESLAERLLAQLEEGFRPLDAGGTAVTGWPADVRIAG